MDDRARILIIDDERFYIDVLVGLLRTKYQTFVAKSGTEGMELALNNQVPDLILLDVLMPDLDGYEVCRRLKADERTRHVPIIFLTVKSEVDDEIRGLELGAVDYIIKPISPPIVLARVATHLALAKARCSLREQNELLEQRVKERTSELARTQDATIYLMASLAETRDNETGQHIHRTQYYVKTLADALRTAPGYRECLNDAFIDLLFKSAPMHDIGKVGVPDHILLKPGPLQGEEWEEMKRHAIYGKIAIERVEDDLGICGFLETAKEIAYTHHERWDGKGYPEGLSEDRIPVSGRLMAVADVYDALISRRVYKPAFSHEKAVEIMRSERGQHFDPQVLDAFLERESDFQTIALRFRDEYLVEANGVP
ncbi:response regulator [Thiolapillus brandeum]|uniref:Two-component system response regulator n=1 Tax=Thiolapillus brandeum TaxID=1076588 RepID=A0A7U6JI42_9GAMM|nr:two-component system response regulator [Thiolapillus brandeum]BAO44452.1 two-component system response regulator [Thiolapillus brandeum]